MSTRLRRMYSSLAALNRLDLVALLVVGADDPNACERLLHDRTQIRQLRLDRFEALVDGAAEVLDAHRDHRQRNQCDQGQSRVDGDHQDDSDGEDEDRAGRIHHRRADHHSHGIEVVGGTRHQVAGAPRLVVAKRHLLQPCEERVADVVLDLARGADDDPAHQELKHRPDARDPQNQPGIGDELLTGDTARVRSSMANRSTHGESS